MVNLTATLRRYLPWRAVVFLGLFLFALAVIPTQTAQVVAANPCTKLDTVLFGPQESCPLYKETYRGGAFIFWASLSKHPTGVTTDSASYRSRASVSTGFNTLSFVAELLLSFVVALPITLLISVLRLRSTRTPPYGAVTKRRRMRLSRRRF